MSRLRLMTHATAALLAVAVFLAGLLVAAPAGAQRPHELAPLQNPTDLPPDYCDFPVRITWTEFDQYIIQGTTSPDGTITGHITGHAQATVTNQTTSESVSYNVSGPGTVVLYPSGAFSIDAAGPNLLWTKPEDLLNFPDVPAISYTTGHVTVEVDASGKTTAYELQGRQTDVCAVLAAP